CLAFSGVGLGSNGLLPCQQPFIALSGSRSAYWAVSLLLILVLVPLKLVLRRRPVHLCPLPQSNVPTPSLTPARRRLLFVMAWVATGRSRERWGRSASGGSSSAVSSGSSRGTRCRSIRPSISLRSDSAARSPAGRSAW